MRNTENSNIKLDQVSAVQCRYCTHSTPGATYHEASPLAAPQADENKSCRVALCTSFTSRIPHPANRGATGPMHMTIDKN